MGGSAQSAKSPTSSKFFSKLVVHIQDELAQVFVHVAPIRVESLRDVLQCLEEAVQIHLGVLAAPHHVLVNNVVVGLADVRVSHILKLGQSLELVRRDEVVIFLPSKHLKYRLCLRV